MLNKKTLLSIFCVFICAINIAKAEDRYAYFNRWPKVKYHFAAHVYSPLSAFYKVGTTLEYRRHFVSYKASYFKYYGVYPGRQASFEYDLYLPTKSNKEYYIYTKGVAGNADYDNTKLSFFSYDALIAVKSTFYGGGGVGLGRRYNYKHLFFNWSAGVKYVALDLDSDDKNNRNLYRLFYATGPGALLDVHFSAGFQL